MIVLNQAKELVRVETWEDIQGRPGFTDNLNPDAHELSGIIGQYAFSEKIHCGLSTCRTPHSRGYLVVTKAGLETNMGKDCGKNYFGVDFQTMATQFDRDIRDKEARERLWSFSFQLDVLKERIKDLREGNRGADRIHKIVQQLVDQGKLVPSIVRRRISSMLKTGSIDLTIDRELTEQEYALEEARTGRSIKRPKEISEKISTVLGLEAMYKSNNLREILIIDLEENVKIFESLDIDVLTSKELTRWSKWAGTVEQRLDVASQALAASHILLQRKNLEPFMHLIQDDEEKANFEKYLAILL